MMKIPAKLAGAFFALAALAPAGVAAAESEVHDYLHEIEITEHAAMLVERMGKEAALVALDINSKACLERLQKSHDEFWRILKGLRHGDEGLNLPGNPPDNIINVDLKKVEDAWPDLDKAIKDTLAAGKADENLLEHLEAADEHLYLALEELEHAYTQLSGDDHVGAAGLETTEHLATLIERMAKEYFLIADKFHGAEMRADLAISIDQFDDSLEAVLMGDENLMILPAPTAEIEKQIKKVKAIWKKLEPVFEEVAKTDHKPTEEGIKRIMEKNEMLVEEIEKAALLYEEIT